jgi:hypothetical protein
MGVRRDHRRGEDRGGGSLETGAPTMGGFDDDRGYSVFEASAIKAFKNKILIFIHEVLNVEGVLHGVANEGIKTIASGFSGCSGTEDGEVSKGEVVLLFGKVAIKSEDVGRV